MTLKLVKIAANAGLAYAKNISDGYDIIVVYEGQWEGIEDVRMCSEPLDVREFERLVHGVHDLDGFYLDSEQSAKYSPKDWAESKVLPPESWEEIFNQNYAFDEDDVL